MRTRGETLFFSIYFILDTCISIILFNLHSSDKWYYCNFHGWEACGSGTLMGCMVDAKKLCPHPDPQNPGISPYMATDVIQWRVLKVGAYPQWVLHASHMSYMIDTQRRRQIEGTRGQGGRNRRDVASSQAMPGASRNWKSHGRDSP